MTHQPKRPCYQPGCPNLAHNRSGYCDLHQRNYNIQRDINRDISNQRGYTYGWQTACRRFLTEHPLCVVCQSIGQVTAASVVDHIIPHKGNQALFRDQSNWPAVQVPPRPEGRQTGINKQSERSYTGQAYPNLYGSIAPKPRGQRRAKIHRIDQRGLPPK